MPEPLIYGLLRACGSNPQHLRAVKPECLTTFSFCRIVSGHHPPATDFVVGLIRLFNVASSLVLGAFFCQLGGVLLTEQ